MKRKMTAFLVMFFSLALIMVFWEEHKHSKKKHDASDNTSESGITESVDCYTYGEVAKDVQYLAADAQMSQELERLIDPLSKSQPVTTGYIREVAGIVGISPSVYDHILSGSDDAVLTKEEYDTVFLAIVMSGTVDGLAREELFVLDVGTEKNGEKQYVSTGNKTYVLDTELAERYEDSVVDAYVRNGTIFHIIGYGLTSATFHNAWLAETDGTSCTFRLGDIEKTYEFSPAVSDTDCKAGQVVSLTVDNTGVLRLTPQTDIISVRVNEVSENGLRVNNQGTYTCSPDFVIYNCEGELYCEESKQILVGYPSVDLVLESGKVIAAVVRKPLFCDEIRVILSNDDYSSYDMERVMLTCDKSFSVTDSEEKETYYAGGENISFLAENYEEGDCFTIAPTDPTARIQITSILRSYGNPLYAGKIEVHVVGDNMLHIINVVPLEEYLYSVVASEMPSNCHPEAQRALAICARGYAYTKLSDESFADYDAHLDDSSLCQMYNNVQATRETMRAVKDTYGIVPVYGGDVILPLYFSTSAGMTCTNEEIWGGTAYEYLESNLETLDKDEADISDEDMFRNFMENSFGFDIIDKEQPYYRWTISYTKADMTDAVNSMLVERIRMSPDNIRVKTGEDTYEAAELTTIGNILSVEVTERTQSGVVAALELVGTDATIQVTGQTNIRMLLTPVGQEIIRQDGQVITGWTSLPSPFYYVAEEDGMFVIHGGGFGHGVGMSQMGANVLAEQGYNYKYILRHYYSDIDFSMIYTMDEDGEEGTN